MGKNSTEPRAGKTRNKVVSARKIRTATVILAASAAAASLSVWMLVSGAADNSASVQTAVVTASPSPTEITATAIVLQPQDTRIATRGYKKLSVSVESPSKVTYKWYRQYGSKWVQLPGQTKAKLVVAGTERNNNAKYRVVVTGADRTVTSEVAQTKVVKPTQTPVTDYLTRSDDSRDLIQGVDLSKWNHLGDMQLLKAQNWSFVIAKTGGSDRGHIYIDATYKNRINVAKEHGLKVGHYWFNGGNKPAKAAKAFVKALHSASASDPIVLDVERWVDKHGTTQAAWNPAQVNEFLDKVEDLRPDSNLFVYMTEKQTMTEDWSVVAGKARLWVASWRDNVGRVPALAPTVGFWENWTIWQYSSFGRPAGFGDRRIDVNIAAANAWQ